jgi:hypothetical protein
MVPTARAVDGRFRILTIANQTVEREALHELICTHAAGRPCNVLVVAPALDSGLRPRFRRGEDARRVERARIARVVERLESEGIPAHGWTGAADPLEAIADALTVFRADELIIATNPEWRSDWLAHDVVDRAREQFGLPTEHLIVYGAGGDGLLAA